MSKSSKNNPKAKKSTLKSAKAPIKKSDALKLKPKKTMLPKADSKKLPLSKALETTNVKKTKVVVTSKKMPSVEKTVAAKPVSKSPAKVETVSKLVAEIAPKPGIVEKKLSLKVEKEATHLGSSNKSKKSSTSKSKAPQFVGTAVLRVLEPTAVSQEFKKNYPYSGKPYKTVSAKAALKEKLKNLDAANDIANLKNYQITDRYTVGDRVSHDLFGQGMVKDVIGEFKIKVIFKDCEKILVHGVSSN